MRYELEPEQIDLLRAIAEAARDLPREKREFIVIQGGWGSQFDEVAWDGGRLSATARDVEDLISAGLLTSSSTQLGWRNSMAVRIHGGSSPRKYLSRASSRAWSGASCTNKTAPPVARFVPARRDPLDPGLWRVELLGVRLTTSVEH